MTEIRANNWANPSKASQQEISEMASALDAHDDFCPWVKGDTIHLEWKPAPAKDLMRSGNVCTTIVL